MGGHDNWNNGQNEEQDVSSTQNRDCTGKKLSSAIIPVYIYFGDQRAFTHAATKVDVLKHFVAVLLLKTKTNSSCILIVLGSTMLSVLVSLLAF